MGLVSSDKRLYAIECKNGKSYIARVDSKRYEVEVVKDSDGKEVLNNFVTNDDWVVLQDCYVLVPQEIQGRVQPIPVKFSDMPTGSSRILVDPSNIAEINIIDDGNKLAQALRQIEGGIISSADEIDTKNSSRSLNKFSK